MQHVEKIKLIIAETGMSEMAAINRYRSDKVAADARRERRPLQSTNWLK